MILPKPGLKSETPHADIPKDGGLHVPQTSGNGRTDISSADLRSWFKGSKVVDKEGNPLRVYHGTTQDFESFDPEAADRAYPYPGGTSQALFFTSCPEVASGYAGKERLEWRESYRPGGRTLPVYLRILKPLKANAKGESWQDIIYKGEFYTLPELVELAKKQGKDGVIVSNVHDCRNGAGGIATTYVVFQASQVRSAITKASKLADADPEPIFEAEAAGYDQETEKEGHRTKNPHLSDFGRIPSGASPSADRRAEGLGREASEHLHFFKGGKDLQTQIIGKTGKHTFGSAESHQGQGSTLDWPLCGSTCDGLEVTKDIPNTGSISATFTDYEVLKGIREVPMSVFDAEPRRNFYSAHDLQRVKTLAEKIQDNGWIDPLIVAVDEEGPYILEGGHRLCALFTLGKTTLPAMVVIEQQEGKTASRRLASSERKTASKSLIKGGGMYLYTIWKILPVLYHHKMLSRKKVEKTIAEQPWLSVLYAKNVLKGRFPEGETGNGKLLWDLRQCCLYCDYLRGIGQKFEEGEKALASDPDWSLEFARSIEDRFPEGEKAIATSAKCSFKYLWFLESAGIPFLDNVKFSMLETISKSAEYSFLHAKNDICPFPDGEKAISEDPYYTHEYLKYLREVRQEPANPRLFALKTAKHPALAGNPSRTTFGAEASHDPKNLEGKGLKNEEKEELNEIQEGKSGGSSCRGNDSRRVQGMVGGCDAGTSNFYGGSYRYHQAGVGGYSSDKPCRIELLKLALGGMGYSDIIDGPLGGFWAYSSTHDKWCVLIPQDCQRPEPGQAVYWTRYNVEPPDLDGFIQNQRGWAKLSYKYARNVLQPAGINRFELGEPAIAKEPHRYAEDVLHPLGLTWESIKKTASLTKTASSILNLDVEEVLPTIQKHRSIPQKKLMGFMTIDEVRRLHRHNERRAPSLDYEDYSDTLERLNRDYSEVVGEYKWEWQGKKEHFIVKRQWDGHVIYRLEDINRPNSAPMELIGVSDGETLWLKHPYRSLPKQYMGQYGGDGYKRDFITLDFGEVQPVKYPTDFLKNIDGTLKHNLKKFPFLIQDLGDYQVRAAEDPSQKSGVSLAVFHQGLVVASARYGEELRVAVEYADHRVGPMLRKFWLKFNPASSDTSLRETWAKRVQTLETQGVYSKMVAEGKMSPKRMKAIIREAEGILTVPGDPNGDKTKGTGNLLVYDIDGIGFILYDAAYFTDQDDTHIKGFGFMRESEHIGSYFYRLDYEPDFREHATAIALQIAKNRKEPLYVGEGYADLIEPGSLPVKRKGDFLSLTKNLLDLKTLFKQEQAARKPHDKFREISTLLEEDAHTKDY